MADGTYSIQASWNGFSDHATNAPYTFFDGSSQLSTTTVNQQLNPNGTTVSGVAFQTLATVTVHSGVLRVVLSNNANAIVVADAIRIVSA